MSETQPSRNVVNKVFGDVLPDVTRDEYDDQSPSDDRDRDRWLRDNVPPHHR
ncbi:MULTISPECIES: hypothetical protein [unclassified Mycolicibacterium]|uniref:hypothetical protein n=1 Tax=unclassified Mycolicibacterium TaxID=2636767 RepID=UPI00141234D5|nr:MULTISPECIES: hypothetical protein [unclassified Mycolicibacterium]